MQTQDTTATQPDVLHFETERAANIWLKQFIEVEILRLADVNTFLKVLDDLNQDHFTNERIDMDPAYRAEVYWQHQYRIDFFRNLKQWQRSGENDIDKLDSIVWDWLVHNLLEDECALLKAMFKAHYTHPIHEDGLRADDREGILLVYEALVDTIVPGLIGWNSAKREMVTKKATPSPSRHSATTQPV